MEVMQMVNRLLAAMGQYKRGATISLVPYETELHRAQSTIGSKPRISDTPSDFYG